MSVNVSYAGTCEGELIHDTFSRADAILQVELMNAPMTDDEFKLYLGDRNVNFNNQYASYLKRNNIYLVKPVMLFKGSVDTSTLELSGSLNSLFNFNIGNEYVVFLRKKVHNNKTDYIVDNCVHIDFSRGFVVWERVIEDRVLFKMFINELYFYKENGILSDDFSKIRNRYSKIENR